MQNGKVLENSAFSLTQILQIIEKNPCCDCKESGLSTVCRCKDKKIYDCVVILRDLGKSEEEIIAWFEQAGLFK